MKEGCTRLVPRGGEKRSALLSNLRPLHRHIHRRPGSTQETNMTFQLTTTQALKSFTGAAIFGLGMDLSSLLSCQLSDAIWFALREVARVLFWGVLAGSQATHAQIFGHSLFLLGCPL